MTPDQIEAERTKFEAWYPTAYPNSARLDHSDDGSYLKTGARLCWSAWLARAEEQYASERKGE